VYTKAEAEKLATEKGWSIVPDGAKLRRVVASPRPKRIVEIRPVKAIGSLAEIEDIVNGSAGTQISMTKVGISFR